jgi:hypothetical protein
LSVITRSTWTPWRSKKARAWRRKVIALAAVSLSKTSA